MTRHPFLIATLVLLFAGCDMLTASHQVHAQAELRILYGRAEHFKEREGRWPTTKELWAYALEEEDGTEDALIDPWGREYHYRVIQSAEREHILVLCYGKDGRLDVEDIRDYLTWERQPVDGKADSDLVMVDGTFVQYVVH